MKFEFIDAERACFPIDFMCQQLGVSRSGYYAWKQRPESERDKADRALAEESYVDQKRAMLAKYNLRVFAISNHLVGQAVCDHPIDERHRDILSDRVWGDGDPEGVRQRAAAVVARATAPPPRQSAGAPGVRPGRRSARGGRSPATAAGGPAGRARAWSATDSSFDRRPM